MAIEKVLIRPPKGTKWKELFRYEPNGKHRARDCPRGGDCPNCVRDAAELFVPDDGKPGLAFFGRIDEGVGGFNAPYAFCYGTRRHYATPPWHDAAMDACCSRYGVANGRRVTKQRKWCR